MMRTNTFLLFLWMAVLCSPALAGTEFYQWTDALGIIHFTDNLSSVPAEIRASSDLLIRRDFDLEEEPLGISSQPQEAPQEQPSTPAPPEAAGPPETGQKSAPPIIKYSSEITNIVVVNSVVHPVRKHSCRRPEGCQGVFRPSFSDRQYIHPSSFDGGSRQYVQPELFPSVRK